MRQRLEISERRACGLVGLTRTTLRRPLIEPPDTGALRLRIIDLAHARRRFGYRRIHDLLRREGVRANHKKVYRLYREEALSVRKRRRKKGVMVDRQVLQAPTRPNEVWSIDFGMDALANGDVLLSTDLAAIDAWMDNYCSAYPLEPIGEGALQLLVELANRMPRKQQ